MHSAGQREACDPPRHCGSSWDSGPALRAAPGSARLLLWLAGPGSGEEGRRPCGPIARLSLSSIRGWGPGALEEAHWRRALPEAGGALCWAGCGEVATAWSALPQTPLYLGPSGGSQPQPATPGVLRGPQTRRCPDAGPSHLHHAAPTTPTPAPRETPLPVPLLSPRVPATASPDPQDADLHPI